MKPEPVMPRPALPIQNEPDSWEIPAEPADRRPAVRPPRRRLSLLRTILVSGVAVGGLAWLAQQQAPSPSPSNTGPVSPPTLTAPAPLWQPITDPGAVYALELPDRKSPAMHEARRHADGGREDTFVIRSPGEPGYGQLSLARGVSEPEASFYLDLVRRAARAGLSVVRNGQSRAVATKFGAVEAADAVLASSAEQSCLAFRFVHPDIGFTLHGWLCSSEASLMSDPELACLLDRIVLVNGGADAALKVLFAQAEKHRGKTCPQTARVATARKGGDR